jgi:hypothetical protein
MMILNQLQQRTLFKKGAAIVNRPYRKLRMLGTTSPPMKNEKIKMAKRSRYCIASNVMSMSKRIWSIVTIVKYVLQITIITASFSANA